MFKYATEKVVLHDEQMTRTDDDRLHELEKILLDPTKRKSLNKETIQDYIKQIKQIEKNLLTAQASYKK